MTDFLDQVISRVDPVAAVLPRRGALFESMPGSGLLPPLEGWESPPGAVVEVAPRSLVAVPGLMAPDSGRGLQPTVTPSSKWAPPVPGETAPHPIQPPSLSLEPRTLEHGARAAAGATSPAVSVARALAGKEPPSRAISQSDGDPLEARRSEPSPEWPESARSAEWEAGSLPSLVRQMILQPIRREEVREHVVERIPGLREVPLEASLRSEFATGPARETESPPDAARPAPERPHPRITSSPRLVPRVERLPPPEAAALAAPAIHVTIGRIEVRAISDAAAAERPRPRPAVPSLDEYLAPRANGGR